MTEHETDEQFVERVNADADRLKMCAEQYGLVRRNLIAQAKAAVRVIGRSTGDELMRVLAVHAAILRDLDELHKKCGGVDATADAVARSVGYPRSMGVIEARSLSRS